MKRNVNDEGDNQCPNKTFGGGSQVEPWPVEIAGEANLRGRGGSLEVTGQEVIYSVCMSKASPSSPPSKACRSSSNSELSSISSASTAASMALITTLIIVSVVVITHDYDVKERAQNRSHKEILAAVSTFQFNTRAKHKQKQNLCTLSVRSFLGSYLCFSTVCTS